MPLPEAMAEALERRVFGVPPVWNVPERVQLRGWPGGGAARDQTGGRGGPDDGPGPGPNGDGPPPLGPPGPGGPGGGGRGGLSVLPTYNVHVVKSTAANAVGGQLYGPLEGPAVLRHFQLHIPVNSTTSTHDNLFRLDFAQFPGLDTFTFQTESSPAEPSSADLTLFQRITDESGGVWQVDSNLGWVSLQPSDMQPVMDIWPDFLIPFETFWVKGYHSTGVQSGTRDWRMTLEIAKLDLGIAVPPPKEPDGPVPSPPRLDTQTTTVWRQEGCVKLEEFPQREEAFAAAHALSLASLETDFRVSRHVTRSLLAVYRFIGGVWPTSYNQTNYPCHPVRKSGSGKQGAG